MSLKKARENVFVKQFNHGMTNVECRLLSAEVKQTAKLKFSDNDKGHSQRDCEGDENGKEKLFEKIFHVRFEVFQ